MTSRRQTRWVDRNLDMQVASGAQTVLDLVSNIDEDERAGWTLTRLIFCYDLSPIIQGVALGAQVVDIGIGIFSLEAVAAGALPDPATETDYPVTPWLYRCRHRVLDDTVEGHPPQSFYRDLKAQRRVRRSQPSIIVDNTADSGTPFSVVLIGICRSLYLT